MSFDDMCRMLASPMSRRRVFQTLLGTLAAAAIPQAAQAYPIVKTVQIYVQKNTKQACNNELLRRVNVVNCPAYTTRISYPPKSSLFCVKVTKLVGRRLVTCWVGTALVRCEKRPVSPCSC